MWLYEIVDVFFPSIYLAKLNATYNRQRVDQQLREARRVRDLVANRHPSRPKPLIFTFTWMDYDIPGSSTTHLHPLDLETAFARPASVWGVAGSVVWGSSIDTRNATLCGTGPGSKSAYVNHSLGPIVRRAVAQAKSCTASVCSGHGTCWHPGGVGPSAWHPGGVGPSACDCDHGWTGDQCASKSELQQPATAPGGLVGWVSRLVGCVSRLVG